MTDTDLISYFATMQADAETRGDRAAAAWCRNSIKHVSKINTEMERTQAAILALIPERERGAFTATAVAEGMVRLNAAVDAAVAEAERVADEVLAEDQVSTWYPKAEADQHD
ncbi:hypothetical protein ACFWXB_13945 [Tsukamurella tyrosinosolvens]|uniref:hypothetical protein n=1 Tax=Tsukamurella tyrosinosolvens TaxID=57704 RepID=UPI002DD43742|nr:hypothetical protein [Tsukamurella tyrosinosolvens]MEC4612867.1 hypothetical protein [Tsukamurella tyrosinosolvens]